MFFAYSTKKQAFPYHFFVFCVTGVDRLSGRGNVLHFEIFD